VRQTIKTGRDDDEDTGRDDDEATGRDGRNTIAGFPQLLCLQLVSVQIVIVIAVSNTQAELS
jgi:hypothetical protein